MDDTPARKWIAWTIAYIAFVLAITAFAAWVWPQLGPWVWSHF